MARLLTWLGDLLILFLVIRLISRALFGGRKRGRAQQASPKLERSGGTLVRDPHCGTYIPESRAIRTGSGAKMQFFCSTACRDAYLAAEAKGA